MSDDRCPLVRWVGCGLVLVVGQAATLGVGLGLAVPTMGGGGTAGV